MKRQIRRSVFETNSSSQHSLVIKKQGGYYTSEDILENLYLTKDGVWRIWDSDLEFGRSPFNVLGTFESKWLYACASLVDEYMDNNYKELETIAFKYVCGLKKILLPTICKTVYNKDSESNRNDEYVQNHGMTREEFDKYSIEKEKQWCGTYEFHYWEKENGDWEFDVPYTGYVDEAFLKKFLKKENISVEEFITNKKYVIIQDGDEYCVYDNMKNCGLVNIDAIDHEIC